MKDGALDWTPMGQTAVAALGKDRGWTTIAFDAQTLAQNAGGTLAFEGGKLQVRLTFARAGTPIAPTDALYLDTVGTGRAGSAIPYQSLSGTSMATPMVTGAAMVLAQDVDGSTPAERAAKLAALVKASVRPVDAFSGKCSSLGWNPTATPHSSWWRAATSAQLRVREACTSAARRLLCAPGRTAPS